MTVVAFDGKILAADRKGSSEQHQFRIRKIFQLDDGSYVGFAGVVCSIAELIHWFNEGEDPEDFPDCQDSEESDVEIIRIKDGKLLYYHTSAYPVEIREQFYAIGNGAPYAIASMHHGNNAIEAVKTASIFCPDCGLGIDHFDITQETENGNNAV